MAGAGKHPFKGLMRVTHKFFQRPATSAGEIPDRLPLQLFSTFGGGVERVEEAYRDGAYSLIMSKKTQFLTVPNVEDVEHPRPESQQHRQTRCFSETLSSRD